MTPERHAQLQEIFETAVNLAEPLRSNYLNQACDGDSDLRDRLNRLLSADEDTLVMAEPIAAPGVASVMECPKCLRCFDSPLTECPADGTALQPAFAGRLLVDGKYLVERRLGRGGMGAVYLAQHIGLEKKFALKLILQDGDLSTHQRDDFETEARALGRLNHRNIVSVTDYGIDLREHGLPYLVMEYLMGQPLSALLKDRQSLPFEEAIGLLRDAANAVDAAHSSNIVHGDLKPGNLFLAETPDAAQRCLKVVDFGLARLMNSEKSAAGHFRGTPAYMAPELLRSEAASPASDRFAFGALLYELLTGHPPFGRYLSEVAANIQKPPAAPSSLNPALPSDIDAPVLALLNRDPEKRPASASLAVAAVEEAWLRAEQRKWRSREWPRRLMLAVAATACAVLLSAGVMQLRLARVLEGRIADQRFTLLPPTPPNPELALVSLDDATLEADQLPLGDRADEFASMIDRLFASGARAVAVDMLLPARWGESQEFARAVISHAGHLVLAVFAAPSGDLIGTECVSRLTAYILGPQRYANLFGLTNLEEDEDRTIRRARLFYIDKAGQSRPSFAGLAVEAAFPGRASAIAPRTPLWIDYSVRLQQLKSISWKDVPARLSAAPGLFRDRVVIVGATFAGNNDEHRVPPVASDTLLSGQFVQALIANTILAGNPIREVPRWRCWLAVGVACLAVTAFALCFPQHYLISVIASVILLGGYAGLAFWIFRASRTMIAVAGPEFVIVFSMLAAWGLKSYLSPFPRSSASSGGSYAVVPFDNSMHSDGVSDSAVTRG